MPQPSVVTEVAMFHFSMLNCNHPLQAISSVASEASYATTSPDMKPPLFLIFCTVVLAAAAEEEVALKAPSGRFTVVQDFRVENDHGEAIEVIRFSNPGLSPVRLEGHAWKAQYHLSPDERALVRIQKTGSGACMLMLYRLEDNGRVTEVVGLDDLLWQVADRTAHLKRDQLFHTTTTFGSWSDDTSSVEVVLRGTSTKDRHDQVEIALIYDLKAHRVTVKSTQSERLRDSR
jgi:hypothetical protein